MIVVTGGAGFIGSALIWGLNRSGSENILVVDSLAADEKWKNLVNLKFADYMEKENFLEHLLLDEFKNITAIIHMGACSSTLEKNASYLIQNNFEYTKILAQYAVEKNIRFIYASSAATYGNGADGYRDTKINGLKPLNMYGYSKHLFDLWAQGKGMLDKIAGIKYFNVYGPNEYHKDDMRSMINKAFYQINETGKIKLFKSYKHEYKDGEQKRDFIYIKDAVDMTLFFIENKDANGIFNAGTGHARTWNDLAEAVFKAMDKKQNITYFDMPDILKEKYQYFTQADIKKLYDAGYKKPITSLEAGVTDYVKNYLLKDLYLGA
ncbi:ADP-glyceromanno-heptose 6-epimerase [bacterium]